MNEIDNTIDWYVCHGCQFLPIVGYLLINKEAQHILHITYDGNANFVLAVGWILTALLLLVFFGRQVQLLRNGNGICVPKILAVLLPIITTCVIYFPPLTQGFSVYMIIVVITSSHDIQYIALLQFYNSNRYHSAGKNPEWFGIAHTLSKNIYWYQITGMLFTVSIRYFDCKYGFFTGCNSQLSTVLIGKHTFVSDAVVAVVAGIAAHHYFVDQYIWVSEVSDLICLRKHVPIKCCNPI